MDSRGAVQDNDPDYELEEDEEAEEPPDDSDEDMDAGPRRSASGTLTRTLMLRWASSNMGAAHCGQRDIGRRDREWVQIK